MFFHVKRLTDIEMPKRATPNSAGYDLFAPENGFLDPLQRKLIGLGFAASFTAGWVGLLLDKSGMGNKGLTRLGGVIDADYRDEWKVILYNTTHEVFRWSKGHKLIQVVFMEYGSPEPQEVSELEETNRKGGFGSTGL